MHRFVLTGARWAKMEPLCLGMPADPGRTGGDRVVGISAAASLHLSRPTDSSQMSDL
jgi:hypothetical protein